MTAASTHLTQLLSTAPVSTRWSGDREQHGFGPDGSCVADDQFEEEAQIHHSPQLTQFACHLRICMSCLRRLRTPRSAQASPYTMPPCLSHLRDGEVRPLYVLSAERI